MNKGRMVVAMSGGVDSSVTAALLMQQGWEVIGVTMQLYDHGKAVGKSNTCCAGKDIHDARRVADALGIPHYVVDFESRFRQDVIEAFADSYQAGETPIPCVLCNETVKFRDLIGMARELGADGLATGHYVQRVDGAGGAEMHRGADPARDQSYFLYRTTREQLDFLYFPLGGMLTKDETRRLAEQFALPTARKPDSQDICFVPDGDYAALVTRLRPETDQPGEIVDLEGRVLGQHRGLIHYTVGQRKGLNLGGGPALYVVRLDPASRRVVVGPKDALGQTRITLKGMNWLAEGGEGTPIRCAVKVRSTRPPAPATLTLGQGGTALVELDEPQEGVAPGQACVAYDGERLLGGGWIIRS